MGYSKLKGSGDESQVTYIKKLEKFHERIAHMRNSNALNNPSNSNANNPSNSNANNPSNSNANNASNSNANNNHNPH